MPKTITALSPAVGGEMQKTITAQFPANDGAMPQNYHHAFPRRKRGNTKIKFAVRSKLITSDYKTSDY